MVLGILGTTIETTVAAFCLKLWLYFCAVTYFWGGHMYMLWFPEVQVIRFFQAYDARLFFYYHRKLLAA